MQWLGEVSALEESLRHIANKKRQAERQRQQANQGEAGANALGWHTANKEKSNGGAMTPAIFGLVGTLLGAVTVLIGSALADRRQARREEERWRREQRGTAYAETLRCLLRVNRIYGEPDLDRSKIEDQPEDWVNDVLDAQYWLRILTMRCRTEERERLSLLALRLDEAVNMLSSRFKIGYTVVIVQACIAGVIECAQADVGIGATPTATPPTRPARPHAEDEDEAYDYLD